MRRVVVAAVMAMGAIGLGSAPALAWATSCDWDPVVLVVTPAGHVVPVYDSVWTAPGLNIGLPVESYTTRRAYDRAGRPVTSVDMAISVPAGLLLQFETTDMVTSGPLGSGHVYGTEAGWSGQTLHIKFTLDTA